MLARRLLPILFALIACASFVQTAHATFHLMQVEQIVGGVEGDVGLQAIQLRMRGGLQSQVQMARLRAWDAAGLNPILLVDMSNSMTNASTGDRVLLATAGFQSHLTPGVTPDFTIVTPIPASYLAAGSLTFETDDGVTIYWRVSWGGAGYTGTGALNVTNDANGNANPPFATGLPTSGVQAIRFGGAANAQSVTNAADYALTPGASVWTNNARVSGTLTIVAGVGGGSGVSSVELASPRPNPAPGAFSYSIALPQAGHARVALYSVGGALMRTLIDGDLSAGRHDFSWDDVSGSGPRLASGVYYLRLESEGVQRSHKFVLVR